MNNEFLRKGMAWGLAGMLALTGCQKKEETAAAAAPPAPAQPAAIALVKESERSPHFLTVSRQLELGGTLYGYVDVDGDMLKLAGSLQQTMSELAKAQPAAAPYLKQDYAALFTLLGLTDVKALGLSSVPDGSGYFRNRVFVYVPGERRGLLAGLGGPAAPFAHLNLAPKDTDAYSECEMDLPAVYAALKQVVEKVGGAATGTLMEGALAKAGDQQGFSALKLIQDWKGRTAMVLRFDPEKNLRLPAGPAGFTVPGFSLLVCVDGIAPAVEGVLAKSPLFTQRTDGTRRLFELKQPLPLAGLQPVVAIDGSTLYLATSGAFLTECLHPAATLAQDPEFQQALDRVGHEGNGLSYVSPRFFARLHQLEALNPQLPAESQRMLGLVMRNLPKPDRPLITVRINQPDGILARSYWDRSLKQDVAVLAVYNPVTVGVLAAMAIPAFQKVRTASQEKAVLNNLRQLDAAADQYYLEKGVTTATYDDLVGPGKYVRWITPVAGEDYRQLEFKQGEPLRVRLSSGTVIQYPK